MFNFEYANRIEPYLHKNKIVNKIETFNDILLIYQSIKRPKLYQIMDIIHAIVVFPNGEIFNCNPRDYNLSIMEPLKISTCGIIDIQIEPSSSEYEKYWNEHKMDTNQDTIAIPTEKNCGLWSAYYMWWRINKNDEIFPSSLYDLEVWVEMVCKKYLDNSIDLF